MSFWTRVRLAYLVGMQAFREATRWSAKKTNVSMNLLVIPFFDADDELLLDACVEEMYEVRKKWTEKRMARLEQRKALQEAAEGAANDA